MLRFLIFIIKIETEIVYKKKNQFGTKNKQAQANENRRYFCETETGHSFSGANKFIFCSIFPYSHEIIIKCEEEIK